MDGAGAAGSRLSRELSEGLARSKRSQAAAVGQSEGLSLSLSLSFSDLQCASFQSNSPNACTF